MGPSEPAHTQFGSGAFGVRLGKFLGSLITQRGIEVYPNQILALIGIKSLSVAKEVQRLTGMATTLIALLAALQTSVVFSSSF